MAASLIKSVEEFISIEYDFVIVGGGTAGLAVASRLTENPAVTVGVIEAGKNGLNDPLIDTPAATMQLLSHPSYDWGFKTEPRVSRHQLWSSSWIDML